MGTLYQLSYNGERKKFQNILELFFAASLSPKGEGIQG